MHAIAVATATADTNICRVRAMGNSRYSSETHLLHLSASSQRFEFGNDVHIMVRRNRWLTSVTHSMLAFTVRRNCVSRREKCCNKRHTHTATVPLAVSARACGINSSPGNQSFHLVFISLHSFNFCYVSFVLHTNGRDITKRARAARVYSRSTQPTDQTKQANLFGKEISW